MTTNVWMTAWLIIETIVYCTVRNLKHKSDILRIFYNDIPTLQVFTMESLFQLLMCTSIPLVKGPIMLVVLCWNVLYRQLLLYMSSLESVAPYDYFHLFKRYADEYTLCVSSAKMILITTMFTLLSAVPPSAANKYIAYLVTIGLYLFALLTFEDL